MTRMTTGFVKKRAMPECRPTVSISAAHVRPWGDGLSARKASVIGPASTRKIGAIIVNVMCWIMCIPTETSA